MIHFKNLNDKSAGFSIMEVMIATLMLGLLMTAILSLQNVTFASITDYSARLDHVFALKNKLVTAALNRAKQEESDKPQESAGRQSDNVEERYTLEKINEQSALKSFDNCFIEKVVAQWNEGKITRKETMITFLYKVPEKKDKEKK